MSRTRVLWTPNHRLVPVTIAASATDRVDPSPVCSIESVASSAPDEGPGDGDTAHDIAITGRLTANLRAERSGRGPGRVYTLAVGRADAAGNRARTSVSITVPHSNGLRP